MSFKPSLCCVQHFSTASKCSIWLEFFHFKQLKTAIICSLVYFVCTYVNSLHALNVCGVQKRELGSLELGSDMIVSYHVHAGERAQTVSKSSKGSLTLSCPSSHLNIVMHVIISPVIKSCFWHLIIIIGVCFI